jgi:hypothetical protein
MSLAPRHDPPAWAVTFSALVAAHHIAQILEYHLVEPTRSPP